MARTPVLITCQNPDCDYHMTESGKKLCRNGHNSAGNQQYHCCHCNAYFIETKNTPLFHSRLNLSQVELLAKSSVEKISMRGLSRMTGITRKTISRYNHIFGEHAELLNECHNVNISPGNVEMDEIWSFIYKKQKCKAE
jgi:transposase-like protein